MKEWTPAEIRELRKGHNLYQKDLALLLGVTDQHIYYLERGVRESSKTLRLLLDCVERQLQEKEKEAKKHGKKGHL